MSVGTITPPVMSRARGHDDASCVPALCQRLILRIPATAEGALACPPCPVVSGDGVCRGAHAHAGALFPRSRDIPVSVSLRAPAVRALRSSSLPACHIHRPGASRQDEGIRRAPCGVFARLRPSDEACCTGDGCDRLLPLEVLSARTVILHMRAVSQIAWVQQCQSP